MVVALSLSPYLHRALTLNPKKGSSKVELGTHSYGCGEVQTDLFPHTQLCLSVIVSVWSLVCTVLTLLAIVSLGWFSLSRNAQYFYSPSLPQKQNIPCHVLLLLVDPFINFRLFCMFLSSFLFWCEKIWKRLKVLFWWKYTTANFSNSKEKRNRNHFINIIHIYNDKIHAPTC